MESLSIDQEGQGVERTSYRAQGTHNHARRTHLTHHTYNKTSVKWRSKKTESILILLMTLNGNFNGDVELYNWTGESDHIYWENSYKIPCPWFFVSRTKVFQCLWDFSSCWKIIMQKFSFILFYVISKGYIGRKTICDCSYSLKKCSQLPNREVVESHRIGFDFWKYFWIRNIQSWRDISS